MVQSKDTFPTQKYELLYYTLPWWQIVRNKVSPEGIPLLAKYLQTSN